MILTSGQKEIMWSSTSSSAGSIRKIGPTVTVAEAKRTKHETRLGTTKYEVLTWEEGRVITESNLESCTVGLHGYTLQATSKGLTW
jgi:hypothetical protein